MEYKGLLHINKKNRVIGKMYYLADMQMLLVIKHSHLRCRLEQDIGFSHIHLKHDFSRLMKQIIKLLDLFGTINSDPQKANKSKKE